MAKAGNCVIKLTRPYTKEEGESKFRDMRDNRLTYWISFNAVTGELIRNFTPGQQVILEIFNGEHRDNLVFVLVDNTYRLIAKSFILKSILPGVVSIDVTEPVYDNDMKQALTIFVAENADFVSKYNGVRR